MGVREPRASPATVSVTIATANSHSSRANGGDRWRDPGAVKPATTGGALAAGICLVGLSAQGNTGNLRRDDRAKNQSLSCTQALAPPTAG
jgi:hypothetical protein